MAIRTLARHGVKGVGEADYAYLLRDFVHVQMIGISAAITTFMMRSHDLGNFRPGKLHAGNDFVADHSVICHFLELLLVERSWFTEEALVDGDLADVVQIPSRTECRDIAKIESE